MQAAGDHLESPRCRQLRRPSILGVWGVLKLRTIAESYQFCYLCAGRRDGARFGVRVFSWLQRGPPLGDAPALAKTYNPAWWIRVA